LGNLLAILMKNLKFKWKINQQLILLIIIRGSSLIQAPFNHSTCSTSLSRETVVCLRKLCYVTILLIAMIPMYLFSVLDMSMQTFSQNLFNWMLNSEKTLLFQCPWTTIFIILIILWSPVKTNIILMIISFLER
jgi:hypothetical protein